MAEARRRSQDHGGPEPDQRHEAPSALAQDTGFALSQGNRVWAVAADQDVDPGLILMASEGSAVPFQANRAFADVIGRSTLRIRVTNTRVGEIPIVILIRQ